MKDVYLKLNALIETIPFLTNALESLIYYYYIIHISIINVNFATIPRIIFTDERDLCIIARAL